jgi:hypothetical protein
MLVYAYYAPLSIIFIYQADVKYISYNMSENGPIVVAYNT